ncbi:hypothetical protein KM043_007957 [Ampulex compressa]|nr:hypothetical protein KM043_007957 [Ampulex compressa]
MFSHMILRYLTSPLSWFLINGSSNNRAIKCLSLYHRRVHKYCKNPTFLRKKSERGRMKNWFSKKASSDDVFVISKPTNCAESPDPILDPTCKVAIVIGGANGFGFAAADYLLCGGARRIVIADFDRIEGDAAVQKLCNRHGRARACFVPCDIRNAHQFEVALNQACSQYEKVHILFNDLDKQRFASHRQGDTSSPTGGKSVWQNNTMRGIHYGMKVMGKQNGGPGGIIINCASVLGFMGWPQDPSPVYCMKEPSIETTLDLSKEYPLKDTGVRLVALCPTNKPFSEIGLPDFPNSTSCTLPHERLPCIPLSLAQLSKNHAARKSPIVHVAYLNTKSATRRQNNDINSNSSDINFFGQSKYAITSQGKLSKEIQSVNII